MATKQARNCRVGDIILFKNKESRLITRIENDPHKREPYKIYTTTLSGKNYRFDVYDASNPLKVWGTQEALF